MKQKYYVSVRTMGPYGANKSTKKMCNLVLQKLNHTIIGSHADIKTVVDWLDLQCISINEEYSRNKKIRIDVVWSTVQGEYETHHAVVKIDGSSNGDGSFLQVDFEPVRHDYDGDTSTTTDTDANDKGDSLVCNFLDHQLKSKRKMPRYRKWDYEKSHAGDIIVDEAHDEIIIFQKMRGDYIVPYVTLSKEYGLFVQRGDVSSGGNANRIYYRYATDEEKGVLFNELSVRGLCWNDEMMMVDKMMML